MRSRPVWSRAFPCRHGRRPSAAPDLLLGHDRYHRMGAVAGEPVGTVPDEEVGVQLTGQTEQLSDVAFAVANMNAARGIAQQAGGSAQVVQPAHALLALDRHARWNDPLPEGVRSFELLPDPELDSGHSQRQPVRRHRQARMHQQSADRVHPVATGFVLAATHLCREAHRLRTPAPSGKLRRVMKNEDRAVPGGEPAPSRVEMAPKNIFFAHPVVGEEAVGCLCVGPILASQRDALSEPGFHLLHQLAKAAVQPTVAEGVPPMAAHLPDDPAYAFCPVSASDGEPPQIRIVVEKILPSASLPRWPPEHRGRSGRARHDAGSQFTPPRPPPSPQTTRNAHVTLLPGAGPGGKLNTDLEGRDDKADEAVIFAGIQGTVGCPAVAAGCDA